MSRNKLLSALLILSLGIFIFTSCKKHEVKNIYSEGNSIICFGDSITYGYGVQKGEDYPSILAKMLNTPIVNSGIDADTTTEALKRIDSDVLDRDPRLVIVEFCGNDFLRKVPLEVTINNIRTMIDKIQDKGAMVALVDVSAGLFLRDYRIAFKKLAKDKEAIFVTSVLKGIITNPSMKSDFLHPNSEGYRLIALRIYKAVTPYLNKPGNKALSQKQASLR